MKVKIVTQYRSTLILLALFITGCATQLAPKYDAALFDGLTNTNVKIMELFASVAGGTENTTFQKREKSYNAVIGSIDALALQSRARPMPENSVIVKVNEYMVSRGMGPLTGDVAPSANSLEQISKQLVKMKEVDSSSGLNAPVVAIFKNAVIISMDQAVTYESFLDR
ncbi:MAG: hypothetical protein ABW168_12610 [Sedimenticola sp.]